MLSFSSTTIQSSLVVKTPSSLDPIERIISGRKPSQIIPRLYLSNLFTAQNAEKLAALGVTHVVSVIEEPPNLPESLSLQKLHISIADTSNADILQALAADEKNVVLVHCMMGISRSATVVCAYLVATTAMSASDAIAYTIFKRSVVCPNLGFRRQLETYAAQFRHKNAKPKRNITGLMVERIRLWVGGHRASQSATAAIPLDTDK
ncbi:protein-tyrosine phosphatase-like protein [Amylocystis lapponica]|nr:protein-tyrosine phosphatase-like protein [Amylocystis lapponica]